MNFDKLLLRAIQRVKVKGIYHVFHYQRKYRKFKYVNKYGSLFGLLLVERRMFSSSIAGTRDMMTHRSSIPIPSFSRVIDSVQRRWKVFRCVAIFTVPIVPWAFLLLFIYQGKGIYYNI